MNIIAALYVITALTISILPQPVTAQTNDFGSAIAEYNADNYEEALDILLANNETTRSIDETILLGLSYFNLLNFSDALSHLEIALNATATNRQLEIDGNLALIEIYLAKSELEKASHLLHRVKIKHPIHRAQKNFLKGELSLAENRQKDAIYHYSKAKEQNPSLIPAANFKISQAYVQNHQLSKAKNLLSQTLKLYPDRFESGQLRHSLKEIKRLEKHRFVAQLGYRIEYDSNVALYPDDDTITPRNFSSGKQDFRNTFTADTIFKKNLGTNWRLHSEGHFYQSLLPDLENYNETRFTFATSPTYNKNNWKIHLPLEWSYAKRRQNNNERTVGVLPGITYTLNNGINLHPYLNYQMISFDTPSIENEDRSGNFIGTGLLALLPFDSRQGLIRVLVQYGNNNTKGSNWDNTETNFTSQFHYAIWPEIFANISYQYLNSAYKNLHPLELLKRRDSAHLVMAKLELKFWKNWAVYGQATYVENNSSIAIYDNSRRVVSVGGYWHIR